MKKLLIILFISFLIITALIGLAAIKRSNETINRIDTKTERNY